MTTKKRPRKTMYIPEGDRGSVRMRLPRDVHARAVEIAERSGREVVDVISEAIRRMPMPERPRVVSTMTARSEEREARADREYERMRERDLRER